MVKTIDCVRVRMISHIIGDRLCSDDYVIVRVRSVSQYVFYHYCVALLVFYKVPWVESKLCLAITV